MCIEEGGGGVLEIVLLGEANDLPGGGFTWGGLRCSRKLCKL